VSTPEAPITARELLLSGCIHDVHDGVKVLGDVSVPLCGVYAVVEQRAGSRVFAITTTYRADTGVTVCNQGDRSAGWERKMHVL
jgi:hypothetical protein